MLNRVIGEERYDRMRLFRRTNIARFYWTRQEILYETFLHYPEIANTIGIYPKTDLSHGFPSYSPYEMFRDFQENSINSDVSLACAKSTHESNSWAFWLFPPSLGDPTKKFFLEIFRRVAKSNMEGLVRDVRRVRVCLHLHSRNVQLHASSLLAQRPGSKWGGNPL